MKSLNTPLRGEKTAHSSNADGAFAVPANLSGFKKKTSPSLGLAARIAAGAANARPNEGGNAALESVTPVGEAEGGAAAHRLEKRTHLDEASYRVTLRNYGNGLGEIGWSFIPALPPSKALRGTSEKREENNDRAGRRAKSRLRHLILAVRADHLLTLTYRANVTDFNQATSDLSRFVRKVKSKLPGWVYIGVAERQERGAWHWHLAVCGRQDVGLLRSCWLDIVGEGNIDVSAPKGKGKFRELALVKYLGKYLAKGFNSTDRNLNARRFRASLGIEVPVEYLTVPKDERGNVTGFALTCLQRAAGSVGFVWNADDKTAGWACSWK